MMYPQRAVVATNFEHNGYNIMRFLKAAYVTCHSIGIPLLVLLGVCEIYLFRWHLILTVKSSPYWRTTYRCHEQDIA